MIASFRIAIDGIFMESSQPGGYRTYTTNLVSALAQLPGAHDFRLLVSQPGSLRLPTNWRVDSLRRTGSLGFVTREQLALPRYLKAQGIDMLHAPGATGPLRLAIPLVVTLFDTIELTDPLPPIRQAKRWAMRLYSRLVQAQVARIAKHVITVSAYSKRQIVKKLGIAPEKVTVTPCAPAPQYSPACGGHATSKTSRNTAEYGYVLGIASAAPRKNTGALLTAYDRLPKALREERPLVLVCTHAGVLETMQAKIALLSLRDDVRLLAGVDDGELVQLYRAAGAFVFPSLEEGFGLPPLEAMACGTPVVASNTSSLPEVLGDAALLVDPTDVGALSGAIQAVITDPSLADSLRHRGLTHCQQFSWERTAKETVAVYEAVGVAR